jgi:hypothetical protein
MRVGSGSTGPRALELLDAAGNSDPSSSSTSRVSNYAFKTTESNVPNLSYKDDLYKSLFNRVYLARPRGSATSSGVTEAILRLIISRSRSRSVGPILW